MTLDLLPSAWAGIAVAGGCGLLIGLERERRKQELDAPEEAGIRSFAITALGGALAQTMDQPLLVAVGGLAVGAMLAVSILRRRKTGRDVTSELALFVTYLVGVLCVVEPALGAACGVAVAGLLALRERLHRFAGSVLTDAELHDALVLAALFLVVLPLMPTEAFAGLVPRTVVTLVGLILALQAVGHVALRWLGTRAGAAIGGFLGGFVSSTATVASFGSRVRGTEDMVALRATAGGAVWSTVATWVLAVLLGAAQSPAGALALLPVALAGGLVAAAFAGALVRGGRAATGEAASDAPGNLSDVRASSLRLREALLVAALLSAVTLVVAWAERHYGAAGVFTAATIAGFGDSHAAVLSTAGLLAHGGLTEADFVRCVLLAISANTLTRVVVAWVAGGRPYAWRVGAGLALGTGAAWATAFVLH
ncbi:MAG: DUF4010 domain-containing protein [Rhizobacter sp.]|nr:DUF4010 domain-containing protein [Rhizobacter sp.]